MYSTILWDVDGTLLDFLAAEKCAIRSCFEKFGLGECTDEMLKEYSQINTKYWQRLERGEITKPQVLLGRFQEFFQGCGLDVSVAEKFNAEYQLRLGDTIVFCDNSDRLVKKLRGIYRQYAVSNGTVIAQSRKLRKSGLDKVLDGVFLSEELGAEKPSCVFFDKVFQALPDIKKSEMLIVGDSLTSDILGGNNAGIATCWYNPKGNKNNTGATVDFEISDLNKLFDIL